MLPCSAGAFTQGSWDDAFISGVFFHALRRSDQELTKNYFAKEQTTMNSIKNFLKDETGIETMEYAIIAAIVAAVALLVYGSGWGQAIHAQLVDAANTDTSGVGL